MPPAPMWLYDIPMVGDVAAQTLKVTLPKSKSTDGTADKPQTVAARTAPVRVK